MGWRVLLTEAARLRDSRRKRANNFAPLNVFDFTTLVPFTLLGKAFVIIFVFVLVAPSLLLGLFNFIEEDFM